MAQLPTNADYDVWLRWVFDRPVTDPAWYWNDDEWPDGNNDWPYRYGDATPATASVLSYTTRLFESAGCLIDLFSLEQLDQGLWFLSSGMWGTMRTLFDSELRLEDRLRCVRSFETLYRDLFAKACEPGLSHVRTPANPLNCVCYMCWDLLPQGVELRFVDARGEEISALDESAVREIRLPPENRPIQECMLETLAATLTISHPACREGALHGLGHFHEHFPLEVERIVAAFLHSEPALDAQLRRYAEQAAKGSVL